MKLLVLLLLTLYLQANSIKEEMITLYQNKQFQEACNLGLKHFSNNSRDEEYVSLYSFSCLNMDYVDRLGIPIVALRHSQEGRANASYFATIMLQKKLLYHALLDGYDIASLNLPKTDYILSKVFDLYTKKNQNQKEAPYLFDDEEDSARKYKLYIIKDDKIDKMVIEEFYNSLSVKKHIYW